MHRASLSASALALSTLFVVGTSSSIARAESECGEPPAVDLVQPGADGATVPVGGVVRVFYSYGCGQVSTSLTCAGETIRDLTPDDLERLRIVEHDLHDVAADSRCELVVTIDEAEVLRRAFTVADEEPAPLAAPTIVGGKMYLDNTDGLVSLDVAPDPLGLSKIEVYSGLNTLCAAVPGSVEGGRLDVGLSCNTAALEDSCVRVEQTDAAGRVATAEACLEQAEHEDSSDAADGEPGGCSMSSRGASSSFAPLSLLLAAIAARVATRRARASRVAS